MENFEVSERNRVRRVPDRGIYDKETVYQIVDDGLICHVGFVIDGRPFVIPTMHARREDEILLHGATSSRLMRHMADGNEVCITVTHVDGLVLARSVVHHSANYRSVVLFGRGRLLNGDEAKLDALEAFTSRLIPGRWQDSRPPNRKELKATSVVVVKIDMASAKVRIGPPKDDEEDYKLPHWAGVLPLRTVAGEPEADGRLPDRTAIPGYIRDYVAQRQ